MHGGRPTRTSRGSASSLSRDGFVYANEFEFELDLILDGLERMRAAPMDQTARKKSDLTRG
jgi:hypothetical protein